MDVFIKSFGRPYYLERCIRSVQQHLKGENKMIVLDDGTNPRYLERIRTTYPLVDIRTSASADSKASDIRTHLEKKLTYDRRDIPVKFWKNAISKTGSYFLLLEEDAWLTGPINVESIRKTMEENKMVIAKIYWGMNEDMVKGKKNPISSELEEIITELPVHNETILTPLFKNTLKMRSVLLKTGLISMKSILPFYALYTVSSAFFNRDYWLYLWHDASAEVREPDQLMNALQWKNRHPRHSFGKTIEEKLKTSYLTSSSNTYADISFDMIRFNHTISEAWYDGKLDVMENYPGDFSVAYFSQFIQGIKDADFSLERWEAWYRRFQDEYRQMGFIID